MIKKYFPSTRHSPPPVGGVLTADMPVADGDSELSGQRPQFVEEGLVIHLKPPE
jgi:hypothetical protein